MATPSPVPIPQTQPPNTIEPAQTPERVVQPETTSERLRGHERRREAQEPRKPWDPAKIGFFEPSHVDEEQICMKNGRMYFQHVSAFLDRLRAFSSDKESKKMRKYLQDCLRGVAVDWYMSGLTAGERQSLCHLPLEQGWYRELEQRFKPSPKASAIALLRRDFQNKRTFDYISPVIWAHEMLRLAQAASPEAEPHEHLFRVWNLIHSCVQRYVPQPSKKTPITKFMKDLDTVYNAVGLSCWVGYSPCNSTRIEKALREYYQ